MRGAFNVLISATRTGDIGDAILEFTNILNVDSFAEAVSIIRKVTKQSQLKYALEELLHTVHRRSLKTTINDIYRICGVDNFEDASKILGKIFETDNIVSAALKINRVSKRLDPLYFLSGLIGVTQSDNIIEADAAIRKLTIRRMPLLNILERIRIGSRQSNVLEFFRRLITATGTKSIQQAWEVITRITFTTDIFFFFDMVEKFTEVDALVFIETILKITSTNNINEASALLNKVCNKEGIVLGLFEILEEISTISKMDVIKFFELLITLSNRYYFEEALLIVEEFTETTNLIDALDDLRRATGQPDIPKAIEYIKQNKPSIPKTTTTEQPEGTTQGHPEDSTYDYNDYQIFDTSGMSKTDEHKSEIAYLESDDLRDKQQSDKASNEHSEQPFEQPNTLPTVIIEHPLLPEKQPMYEKPTVIIERPAKPVELESANHDWTDATNHESSSVKYDEDKTQTDKPESVTDVIKSESQVVNNEEITLSSSDSTNPKSTLFTNANYEAYTTKDLTSNNEVTTSIDELIEATTNDYVYSIITSTSEDNIVTKDMSSTEKSLNEHAATEFASTEKYEVTLEDSNTEPATKEDKNQEETYKMSEDSTVAIESPSTNKQIISEQNKFDLEQNTTNEDFTKDVTLTTEVIIEKASSEGLAITGEYLSTEGSTYSSQPTTEVAEIGYEDTTETGTSTENSKITPEEQMAGTEGVKTATYQDTSNTESTTNKNIKSSEIILTEMQLTSEDINNNDASFSTTENSKSTYASDSFKSNYKITKDSNNEKATIDNATEETKSNIEDSIIYKNILASKEKQLVEDIENNKNVETKAFEEAKLINEIAIRKDLTSIKEQVISNLESAIKEDITPSETSTIHQDLFNEEISSVATTGHYSTNKQTSTEKYLSSTETSTSHASSISQSSNIETVTSQSYHEDASNNVLNIKDSTPGKATTDFEKEPTNEVEKISQALSSSTESTNKDSSLIDGLLSTTETKSKYTSSSSKPSKDINKNSIDETTIEKSSESQQSTISSNDGTIPTVQEDKHALKENQSVSDAKITDDNVFNKVKSFFDDEISSTKSSNEYNKVTSATDNSFTQEYSTESALPSKNEESTVNNFAVTEKVKYENIDKMHESTSTEKSSITTTQTIEDNYATYEATKPEYIVTHKPVLVEGSSGSEDVTSQNNYKPTNEVTVKHEFAVEKHETTTEEATLTSESSEGSTNEFDDSVFESPTLIQDRTEFESEITTEDSNVFDISNKSNEEYTTEDSTVLTSNNDTWSTDASKATLNEDLSSISEKFQETSQEIVAKEKFTEETSESDVSKLSSHISSSELSVSEYPADVSETDTSIETHDVEQESISTDQPIITEQPKLDTQVDNSTKHVELHDTIKNLYEAKEQIDKQKQITEDSKLDELITKSDIKETVTYEPKQTDFTTEMLFDTSNVTIKGHEKSTGHQLQKEQSSTITSESQSDGYKSAIQEQNQQYETISESYGQKLTERQSNTFESKTNYSSETTSENQKESFQSPKSTVEYDNSESIVSTTLQSEDKPETTTQKESQHQYESTEHQLKKSQSPPFISVVKSDALTSETNIDHESRVTEHPNKTQSSESVIAPSTEYYQAIETDSQQTSTTENQLESVTPELDQDQSVIQPVTAQSFSSSEKQYESVTSGSNAQFNEEFFTSETSDTTQSASTTENHYDSVASTSESSKQEYDESFISEKSHTTQSGSTYDNQYDTVASTSESMQHDESFTSDQADTTQSDSTTSENIYDSVASISVSNNQETENVYDTIISTSESSKKGDDVSSTFEQSDTTQITSTTENQYDSIASTSEPDAQNYDTAFTPEQSQITQSATSMSEHDYDTVTSTSELNTKDDESFKSDTTQTSIATENLRELAVSEHVYDSVASTSDSNIKGSDKSEQLETTQSASIISDDITDSVTSTSESIKQEYVELFTSEKSETQSISTEKSELVITQSYQDDYDKTQQKSDAIQKHSSQSENQSESNTEGKSDTIQNCVITEKYDASQKTDALTTGSTSENEVINKEEFITIDNPLPESTIDSQESSDKNITTDTIENSIESSTKFETETNNQSTTTESSTVKSSTESNSLEQTTDESAIVESSSVESSTKSKSLELNDQIAVTTESSTIESLTGSNTSAQTIDTAIISASMESTNSDSVKHINEQNSIATEISTVESSTKFENLVKTSDQTTETSHGSEISTIEALSKFESMKHVSDYSSATESTSVKLSTKTDFLETNDQTTSEFVTENSDVELSTKYEILEQSNPSSETTGSSSVESSIKYDKLELTSDQSTATTESSIVESTTKTQTQQTSDQNTSNAESSTVEASTKSETLEYTSENTATASSTKLATTSQEQHTSDQSTATENLLESLNESKTSGQITDESTKVENSPIESSTNSQNLKYTSEHSTIETESSTVESATKSNDQTSDQSISRGENFTIETSPGSNISEQNIDSTSTESVTVEQKSDITENIQSSTNSAIKSHQNPRRIESSTLESSTKSEEPYPTESELLFSDETLPPPPPGSYVSSSDVQTITSSGGKLALNQGKKEIMNALEADMNLKVLILPNGPQGNNCFCTCDNISPPKLIPYSDLPKITDV
ncbi:hypothetical protein O3G_MSEX013794 [Manduca sexta]|uniref:Uncharacterized protein n=2 Tax=Manduca sexta TaxID=7130 RepID=A0A921ZSZ7_MANSE|nr:hypothetical protein O3G_MSEX013794 [Manduca sexta]